MSGILTPPKPGSPAEVDGYGRGGFGPVDDGFGGGGWEPSGNWSVPSRTYRLGMWIGIGGIVMLFAAFTSALVVRRGISSDWVRTGLPPILYLNTLVLLVSSGTLEISRRALEKGFGLRFRRWIYLTGTLGLIFVAGQLWAWRELAARGIYLASNPASSFFYLLTAAHGVHLLGGIVALAWVAWKAREFAAGLRRPTAVEVTAIYWHFMDGLWVYILLLFIARL